MLLFEEVPEHNLKRDVAVLVLDLNVLVALFVYLDRVEFVFILVTILVHYDQKLIHAQALSVRKAALFSTPAASAISLARKRV